MPSMARLGRKATKVGPELLNDQLAYALRQIVELISDPVGCTACAATTCALHRRRQVALDVLKTYEASR